jgi:hypothetical protein
MKKQPPVHLSVNFGKQPFMFDIDGMVKVRNAGGLGYQGLRDNG